MHREKNIYFVRHTRRRGWLKNGNPPGDVYPRLAVRDDVGWEVLSPRGGQAAECHAGHVRNRTLSVLKPRRSSASRSGRRAVQRIEQTEIEWRPRVNVPVSTARLKDTVMQLIRTEFDRLVRDVHPDRGAGGCRRSTAQ